MIRVLALGESEIHVGRKRITLSTEAVFALGFYLVLRAGERLSRDEVVETFWGAHEPTKGRHSLRQMLYRLRQRGFQLDLETAEELYLDPERVECDVAQVLAEEWPETADALQVAAAGRPTPTFSRRYSEHFHEWYDEIRSRVARQHRRGALRQIALARREGRWSDLELWAQHVLQSDPLNEEATLARAESAAMAGSKTMALEILDQYMEELGDRVTQIGLPAKVLRKRIAERRPEWGVRGAREVALVGREGLMARLTGMVDEAGRGAGQAIVLWGAPGIGKSRLAAEMTEYAELDGFVCIKAPTSQGSLVHPNATIMGLVPLLTALPGAAGCHPASLALLERAGRTYRDASPLDPPRTDTTLEDSIARALLDLTQAISIERKLLVLVDDLHNTDPRSRQTLEFLFARASTSRLLWVATSRVRPAHDGCSDAPSCGFLVQPLSEDAATELTEFVCDHNRLYLSEADHRRVARAAGGNPLFVRELTLHSARTALEGPLPRSLRAVMDERLARLSPEQTHVLRLISLLGAHSHVSTLRSITGLSSAQLTSALEDLEFEGVVRLIPTQSLSLHDCWQTTILEGTSPILRAALALDCAMALVATPESNRSESCDWQAAELFSQAGDSVRSMPLFAHVADRMYARGLSNDASSILERALESGGADRPLLALRAQHARALFGSGRLQDVLEACDAGLAFRVPAQEEERSAYALLSCLRLDTLAKLRKDHRTALAVVAAMATDVDLPPDARQLACLTGIVVAFNDTSSRYEDLFHGSPPVSG